MDIVLSAATIVILSPIFAVAAILVALDAGSPVMFWQQRPGRGGVPFRLYKFRTMGPKRDDSGRLRSDDERMSRVGWWLRRLRLDELPQLFNILVGDMSFVGPRPLLPVDQPEDAAARLQVRPGLTGWAQICGGRTISVAKKTELDLWYIRNASLRLDLVIMLRTVPFMIRGERKGTVAKEQDAARELDQGAIAGSLGRPQ
jgi:lipopolysaccharide/colanic/teichoic acid biosynthesis glycosyltransferase